MIITHQHLNANVLKIFITGRIDTVTAAEFRQEIARIPEGTKEIIFDLSKVDYISSAGLREFLICRKKFSEVRLENLHNDVYQIFLVTGFDKFFTITQAENVAEDVLNTPVDAEDSSAYFNVSFKKFLSDKATYSAEKIFVVHAGEAYTWQDLDSCSTVIACDLQKRGVRQGSHVAICGANSINWLLAFFAVQKLGAIAVLANFNLCAKEIFALIDSTDVTHFCYGETYANLDELQKKCGEKISFYSIRREVNFKIRPAVENNFLQIVRADDPAIMIFTSGTTGKLKAVLLSGYNVLNAAQINSHDQTLRADDKTCVILPFFHIFGLVAGIFANAVAGSAIYLPEKIRSNSILELIAREHCTIFHSVPTMLLAMIHNENFSTDKVAALRCTIVSGARTTEAQMKTFRRLMPNNHFLSSYGLSEIAPVSITDYNDSDEKILHTVGKPVKNIQVKIDKPDLNGVGEILVQGFNLMTGYYKLAPTEQAIDEKGWLHTGDLGTIDAEGYLHLTGRIKELIIRGGENIFPAEVETAISEHPNIADVKVLGVPHDFFGEEVCACLKLKSDAFDENEMRIALSTQLAKYKIPAHFLIYDEFPLLGSGKIDSVALKNDAVKKIKACVEK